MKKIQGVLLVLAAALFVSMASPVLAQNDKRAAAILDAMSDKYKNLKSYKAAFTYNPEGGRAMKGDATVKGDKFRLKLAGQEIFNDGKIMATYIKETNEVNIQDYDPAEIGDLNPTQIYTAYKKGYKYSFVKESKEGGQTYETVQLVPTTQYSKVAKVLIKVNKADKSIKSWDILMGNGQHVIYKIDSFQPNASVTDNFFTFNAKQYPGVEVVDLR
jgi:outer membrane lipoprotein-sorting protein